MKIHFLAAFAAVSYTHLPGQFIILRSNEEAERIPLTISSHDDGLITVIFQKAGAGTMELDLLNEGDCLADMAGPLGKPTPVEGYGRVAVLGGGLGCAIALPVARGLHEACLLYTSRCV